MIPGFTGHQVIRKTVVAFGSLFSRLYVITRNKDGEIIQSKKIPITYLPKEKWVRRTGENPLVTNEILTTLPRASFELTNLSYNSSRQLPKFNQTSINGGGTQGSPTPYDLSFNLYVTTKTLDEMYQVMEQILPFFSPE
jgi:hypothetical protein